MPALNTYTVTVTLRYEVAGNDHSSTVKVVEDQVTTMLKRSAPSIDYPVIRNAEIVGIETGKG